MARNKVGELYVDFSADIASFQKSVDTIGKTLSNMERSVHRAQRTLQSAFIVVGGYETAKRAIEAIADATLRAEKAHAALQSAITSTGAVAGRTAGQLSVYADKLSRQSLFDNHDIEMASATLVRFRAVAGSQLEQTLQLTADFAQASGRDIGSAAEIIGKALQNPTNAAKALKSAYITLTPAENEQIKQFEAMGQHADAVRVILNRLETAVGGSAAAADTGLAGSLHHLKNAWDDFLEALGRSGIIDVMARALNGLAKAAEAAGSFLGLPAAPPRTAEEAMARYQQTLKDKAANAALHAAYSAHGFGFLPGEKAIDDQLTAQGRMLTMQYFNLRAMGGKIGNGGLSGPDNGPDDATTERMNKLAAALQQVHDAYLKARDGSIAFLDQQLKALGATRAQRFTAQGEALQTMVLGFADSAGPKAGMPAPGLDLFPNRAADLQSLGGMGFALPGGKGKLFPGGTDEGNAWAQQAAKARKQQELVARYFQEPWRQAIRNMQDLLAGFFADLGTNGLQSLRQFASGALSMLAQVAAQVASSRILMAVLGSATFSKVMGSPTTFSGGGEVTAGLAHTGGVAGHLSVQRTVPAALFGAAPRYHAGGIAGLRPDEVPAILLRGERVLPRGQASGTTVHVQQTFAVSAMDVRGVDALLRRHAPVIADITLRAVQQSRGYGLALTGGA